MMGMFDNVLGSSVPGGNLAKPLTLALLALLGSGALIKGASAGSSTTTGTTTPDDGGLLGGLGGLLNRFQQNGLGSVISSWIGAGKNQPVAPGQLNSALGPDVINSLSQRTGLSEQELLEHLSKILPGVVDKLTPNNRLPTPEEAAKYQ
jgi:uncharacterized protein YidB (DUF937 family)